MDHVRPDGSLQKEPNLTAIAKAREHQIKILPLINVVPSQDSVLLDERARDHAIANLIRVVKTNKYDGVNIDFEFIPTTDHKDFSVDRDKMTLFIQILNGRLKKMQKKTHLSVLPHVNVPVEMSGVYDYGALTRFVDKVTIMCYDFSQEGSPPPVQLHRLDGWSKISPSPLTKVLSRRKSVLAWLLTVMTGR